MRDGAQTSEMAKSGLQDVIDSYSMAEAVVYHVNLTILFKIIHKANLSELLAGG